MSKQLRDEDKLAVDMLLDHIQHIAAGSVGDVKMAPRDLAVRMEAVRRVLGVLDAWEPSNPAGDLVAATMARIEAVQESQFEPGAELSDSHFGQSLT